VWIIAGNLGDRAALKTYSDERVRPAAVANIDGQESGCGGLHLCELSSPKIERSGGDVVKFTESGDRQIGLGLKLNK